MVTSRPWWCMVCLGLLLLALSGPLSLAVPKPDAGVKPESPAERSKRILEQPLTVDFQGLTLTAAIEALRDLSKLNFVVDQTCFVYLQISPDDSPVDLKLNQVKLRTILKTLLSQYKLTYVIDQEIVVITTDLQAIDRQMQQRVTFEMENLPIAKALQQLARETSTNLVLDHRHLDKIKGDVTLKLEDVPLEVAVRLVAEMAGLRSVRQANVLLVTSKEVAAELRKEEEAANASLNSGRFAEQILFR